MQLLLLAILPSIYAQTTQSDFIKKLDGDIFKGYNSKHRPVKKEQSTVHVSVYLSITHVERVDEREQTMLVHGHLWANWIDEYLTWNSTLYNGTTRITVDAWRVWQPALALYNSARGNSWHLYMNGMPATIQSSGKVWASGAFSFHVTCRFDFTDWPYDEQECPIVVSDWVYDLSRVNLSDPVESPFSKPSIRLNYDPMKQDEKRHVAGWEVTDTWRRHCYWGPSGCKEEVPEGQPEWYWSLLEFGVRLKRHAPYLGLTIILPTIITCMLTLLSFWVDSANIAIALLIFNVLLQGLFGWDLIKEMPPGSGSVPKIVVLYGFNLTMTTLSFALHVMIQYLESVLPEDFKFPSVLTECSNVKFTNLFRAKGLSFDPQLLLNGDPYDEEKEYNSPLAKINTVSLDQEDNTVIEMEDEHREETTPPSTSSTETANHTDKDNEEKNDGPGAVAEQLYLIRRIVFIGYFVAYIIITPYLLF